MTTSADSGPVSGLDESRPSAATVPVEPRPANAVTREEFWNWPNTISVLRMAMVPVFLLMPFMMSESGSAILAWCFIVAAVSDIVDGWLARRGAQVTSIGMLLDPLADKLIVSTALIMLLAVGRLELWAAPMVVVIIGRELAVTGLRGIASAGGRIIPATRLAKVKTVTQNIAVGALIFHFPTIGIPAHEFGLTLLAAATGLTLWSGYHYFASYFSDEPPVAVDPSGGARQ